VLAIISMLFITIGEIFSMPFMNSYWVSRTQANNRGQYAALFTVAWASAQAAGPLMGSLIAENFGYKTLWTIIGIACGVLAFFYRQLHLRRI